MKGTQAVLKAFGPGPAEPREPSTPRATRVTNFLPALQSYSSITCLVFKPPTLRVLEATERKGMRYLSCVRGGQRVRDGRTLDYGPFKP